jgi:hypothetical protein
MRSKSKPFLFLPWLWLKGADQIAEYTDHEVHEVMDWAINWFDCPIRKSEGVWIVTKRDIRKFIEQKKPPRSEVSEIIYIKSRKIQRRYRKW